MDHAAADEDDRGDEADRQQYPQRDARQVDPEVPELACAFTNSGLAGEAADQDDRDGDADRGGHEVLHRQARGLDQEAHRALPEQACQFVFVVKLAVSFTTNTNWQAYSGEATMGLLIQAAGLTVQKFMSAAVGIAVAIVLVRGFARKATVGEGAGKLGNFWVDLTRITLWVLLPISFVAAIVLVGGGVVQNLTDFTSATTATGETQTLTGGLVASQRPSRTWAPTAEVRSTPTPRPFRPTSWTNFLMVYLLLAIPFSLPRTFGRIIRHNRQGHAITAVMGVLALASVSLVVGFENLANGTVPQAVSAAMEGKEVRFGVPDSGLFAAATTLTSTGSVNSFHDSFTSFGGGVLMLNMMLGEVAPAASARDSTGCWCSP